VRRRLHRLITRPCLRRYTPIGDGVIDLRCVLREASISVTFGRTRNFQQCGPFRTPQPTLWASATTGRGDVAPRLTARSPHGLDARRHEWTAACSVIGPSVARVWPLGSPAFGRFISDCRVFPAGVWGARVRAHCSVNRGDGKRTAAADPWRASKVASLGHFAGCTRKWTECKSHRGQQSRAGYIPACQRCFRCQKLWSSRFAPICRTFALSVAITVPVTPLGFTESLFGGA
jgi:hypothetical protein